MTDLAWVVGRGGLLGSHVEAALVGRRGYELFRPVAFSWSDSARLRQQLATAVTRFCVESEAQRGWVVFWCAGASSVGAPAATLAAESETFEFFLACLGRARSRPASDGRFVLASSAGGVWGGSAHRPITEASPPRPISAYGVAQLEKETTLARWAASQLAVSTLTARFSNLYGPGQALGKPQGLVSYLSRALIHGRPAHVFVTLDTIRDYLYVEDAARTAVAATERLAEEASRTGTARHALKIIASEQVTTIGQLLGAFRRTAKRPLPVVTGIHPLASQQPYCLQFRSTVWRECSPSVQISLVEGIERVIRHELTLYQAGSLPPYAY